ncbi:MAG: NAD(P)H-hydrate epimerase, partial [Phycisphaerales bacterium]
ARLLHAADPHRQISAIVLAEPKKTSDAGVNLAALRAMAKESPGWLSITTELTDKTPSASLIVDAMFGSGLTRPLEGAFADAVEWISRERATGCSVLAVDVPSGLDCDTGLPVGGESPTVRADHTLTLGGVKRGILLAASSEWTGSVSAGDLGLPRWLLERFGEAIEEVDQG